MRHDSVVPPDCVNGYAPAYLSKVFYILSSIATAEAKSEALDMSPRIKRQQAQ